MNVQELIDRLSEIKDKGKDICLPYDLGEKENGDPLDVDGIQECIDCVILQIK